METALVRSGVARVSRMGLRGDVLVLAYHNVVPDDAAPSGERPLHLTRSRFASHLDILCETHSFVDLDSILQPPADSTRPRALITFDDAYAGALSFGVEELVSRAIPATVFVPCGLIGRASFWWDDVTRSLSGAAMPAGVRQEAISRLAGRSDMVLEGILGRDHPRSDCPWWEAPATSEILEAASRSPGITFGSHTWSHPNLQVLSTAELREELTRPLGWLQERFACAVPWLSFPYGLEDLRVRCAAKQAGYVGALRVAGGWYRRPGADRYKIPRWNVPAQISDEGFILRTAGLFCR